MFQNAGEAVSYVGLTLVLIFVARIVIAKVRRLIHMGSPPPPFSKSRFLVSALLLIVGCALAGLGDHYRVSMSKDMVLSFYEHNIPYKDLTPAQAKNVTVATVELANANRAAGKGADLSKYRPAVEKYLKEAAMREFGYTPEQADQHARMLLGNQ